MNTVAKGQARNIFKHIEKNFITNASHSSSVSSISPYSPNTQNPTSNVNTHTRHTPHHAFYAIPQSDAPKTTPSAGKSNGCRNSSKNFVYCTLLLRRTLLPYRAASSTVAATSRARCIHAWSSISRPSTSLPSTTRSRSARPMAFSGPPKRAPVRRLDMAHSSRR
jgi:hypothetical protein